MPKERELIDICKAGKAEACFALVEGGKLWKIRMPLPEPDPDEAMPANLQAMAKDMRLNYTTELDWWQDTSQSDAQ